MLLSGISILSFGKKWHGKLSSVVRRRKKLLPEIRTIFRMGTTKRVVVSPAGWQNSRQSMGIGHDIDCRMLTILYWAVIENFVYWFTLGLSLFEGYFSLYDSLLPP